MGAADTIFALSSGTPPAAIGVIRISGPAAGAALVGILGRLPAPRQATVRWFRDPVDGTPLDRGLALWFPGPRTATGEDLAELHIHGGRSVAAAVLAALGKIGNMRPAQPGEFTRRAFSNGVMDLAEAEGLADLLAAETETQRRAALANAGGALSRQVEEWRTAILVIAAQIEAMLDFADEDDVVADEAPVREGIARLQMAIAAVLRSPPAERLRDGVRVVLAGPPNAGKSTLLNALVGREAAIVAPTAGTTRDVVEAPVMLDGIAFVLSDTAGLRASEDPVEATGISRAHAAIIGADLVLWLGSAQDRPQGNVICVQGRLDVARNVDPKSDIAVSAKTGAGMAALRAMLVARATALLPREGAITVNMRQRAALLRCERSLSDALPVADLLLVAECLRTARAALDNVVGRAGVEDMLDALFGQFCIGK